MKSIKATKKTLFETLPEDNNLVTGVHIKVTGYDQDVENNILTIRHKKYINLSAHDTDVNYNTTKANVDTQILIKQIEANQARAVHDASQKKEDEIIHKALHAEVVVLQESLKNIPKVGQNSSISGEFKVKFPDEQSMKDACSDLNPIVCEQLNIKDFTEL